jgi:arylsulfatase A-like enzyme
MKEKRPNIIIFNPDQMRWDSMGHMGNPAAITPNLDQLAREGVSFNNAYCQNPVCTPSRCSFMSGWYPHVRGHRTMHHMMKADEPVLLKQLKDNGYYVWMQNRNDLIPAQEKRFGELANCIFQPDRGAESRPIGSERADKDSDEYYSFFRGKIGDGKSVLDRDKITVDGATEFILNWKEQEREEPLCMFIPLQYPHPPYQLEEPFYSMIDRNKLPVRRQPPEDWNTKPSILHGIWEEQGLQNWSEEKWNELRAVYLGMCSRVDDLLGQVLETLKKAGMYDDSTVFVFSDHGDYTGDYGIVEKNQNTFEDPLVRVPFLIKPSSGISVQPGIRTQMVELIDFYTTVQELAGFPLTHTQFGKSLLPVLADKNKEHREAVYAEGGRLDRELQCADVDVTKPLDKENEYYPRLKQQAMGSPAHAKATMCRTHDYKYIRRMAEDDEFYDLNADPQERVNRINDPALQEKIKYHKELMLGWYQETCDTVPVQLDQRFSVDMALGMRGIIVEPKILAVLEEKMEGKILNSATFKELFGYLDGLLNHKEK